MAKVQTFADKAAKLAKKHDVIVDCPDTGKQTRLLTVRLVETYKSAKGSYKFTDRNLKVYESTFKPYKG
jgi:hypothetical protein